MAAFHSTADLSVRSRYRRFVPEAVIRVCSQGLPTFADTGLTAFGVQHVRADIEVQAE
jgi:hypothetical protein